MKIILQIINKELKEIFRDKASMFIFLIPLFCFPALSVGLSFISQDNNKSESVKTAIVETSESDVFDKYIRNQKDIKILNIDNPYNALSKNDIDFILTANDNTVSITYNSNSCLSLLYAASFGEKYEKYINNINSTRHNDLLSVSICDQNGNEENQIYSMLSILSPCIFILFLFQGNALFANDLFAGEKERKTFEMMLLSVKNREWIYIGKVFTLFILGILNTFICFISYFVSEWIMSQKSENRIAEKNAVFILLTAVICGILSSLTASTVSLAAKNIRQAQLFNEIITFVPTALCILVSLGFVQIKSYYYAVPVFNLICAIKELFTNSLDTSFFILCMGSNIFAVILLYSFSKKLIYGEKIFA